MPILGTPDVEGARASVDVYFQYLSTEWWDSYWEPVWDMNPAIMEAQLSDGWYPGIIYTVTMNRARPWNGWGCPRAIHSPVGGQRWRLPQ